MGTVNLGRIMFQTKGAWSVGTAYSVDDIVTYSGMTFICKVAHTGEYPLQQNNGLVNSQWWDIFQEGFNWKGDWAASTTYYPNDVVRFGKSSYVCRKQHTSSSNNRDPWYDPFNEWDEFVHGGEGAAKNRVKMLNNRGPIGWAGHPFISPPTWGANTWNGNIPWNIPAAAKRWEWNMASGVSRVNMLRCQRWVGADGNSYAIGVSSDYSNGAANNTFSAATTQDPSWMRDYWNNMNPTTGYKATDYAKDTTAGMPTVVQISPQYYSDLVLYSNGTVVRHGYGGEGQRGTGYPNNSTSEGATQVNFAPGTFIVKIGNCNPSGTDDNTTFFALDSEGFVWTWGSNTYGAMGVGSEQTQGKIIGSLNDARSDGSATGSYRDYENTPKRIPQWAFNGRRIVDVWGFGRRAASMYALDETGVLWSWGYNGAGQLGYPTNSGFRHTDGSTVPFEWGRGISGFSWATYGGIQKIQFNSEDHANSGNSTVYILDGQGYLWVCGYNAGYMWGDNATTASTTNAGNPTRLTLSHGTLNGNIHNMWVLGSDQGCGVYVRKSDGTTWGWGINSYYELTDGTTTNRNYPNQIMGVNNAVNMTCSGHENNSAYAALCTSAVGNYRLFMGGRNGYGVLGFGETGGTHATGGSQGAGNFHRPSGYGQYYWQPMYMPAGEDRADSIRDVQMTGGGSEEVCQVLFEDGTMMNTGSNYYDTNNLNYFTIFPYNLGHANTLRKPTGSF